MLAAMSGPEFVWGFFFGGIGFSGLCGFVHLAVRQGIFNDQERG